MFGSSLTKFLKLDNLVSNLTGLIDTKVELVKVEVKDQVSKGIARAVTYALIAFIFAMVMFFISLGVAIILTANFGILWGYGSVALFYAIAGSIVIFNRQTIAKSFESKIKEGLNKKK